MFYYTQKGLLEGIVPSISMGEPLRIIDETSKDKQYLP